MLALDLGQQITRRGLEVLVRGADRAIGLDLDHRLRPIDRRGLGNCVLFWKWNIMRLRNGSGLERK
jgi:hypothetical protein